MTVKSESFGDFVAAAAREAGYDIDSPRGGGRTALAELTGMSASSVGRMLAGQTLPDPSVLERLAQALKVPVLELFVLHGVLSVIPDSALQPAMTIARAAEALGIRDPLKVEIFTAMTQVLVAEQPNT